MRYHSRVPLSSASPNYLMGLSSQRSNPTCSLSLASVSASGKVSSNSKAQVDDMEIDSLTTLVPVLPIDKRCTVPFPKRPHSLLRSTPAVSRPHTTSVGGDRSARDCEEEENLAHDQDPPRKRTRTSAISTSTRTCSGRVASLTTRAQCLVTTVDQPVPPPSSPISSIPSPIPVEFPISSDNSCSQKSTPQSRPLPPLPSHPSPISSRVPFPTGKSSCRPAAPTWSIPRRRRASPEETATSLRLYKLLLYGLAAKYGGQQDNCGMSSATAYLEAVLHDTRSYFDVQDALLAQRLRTFLVINGVDMRQVSIDIQNETQSFSEGDSPSSSYPSSSSCDTLMLVDDTEHSSYPSGTSTTQQETQTPDPNPHFTTSYQRHFATQLMRHQNQFSTRIRGKKRTRQGSSLAKAVEYDVDFCEV